MVLTKQDIQAQINTLLADNTSRAITPQRVRDVLLNLLDSLKHVDSAIKVNDIGNLGLSELVSVNECAVLINTSGVNTSVPYEGGTTPQPFNWNGKQVTDITVFTNSMLLVTRLNTTSFIGLDLLRNSERAYEVSSGLGSIDILTWPEDKRMWVVNIDDVAAEIGLTNCTAINGQATNNGPTVVLDPGCGFMCCRNGSELQMSYLNSINNYIV
ncbi:MAG: hypothetical protein RL660_441 [Bacteroidota bacterium]|jgi:hypothetical protein